MDLFAEYLFVIIILNIFVMFSRYGGTDFVTLNDAENRQNKLYTLLKLYLSQFFYILPVCFVILSVNYNYLLYTSALLVAPLINFSEACERMILMNKSSALVAVSRTLLAPASNLLICVLLIHFTNSAGVWIIASAILISLILRATLSGVLAVCSFGIPVKSGLKIKRKLAVQTTITAGASSLFIATDSILIKYFLTTENFIAYQAIMKIMIIISVASFVLENRYLSSIFNSDKIDYSHYLKRANHFFIIIVLILSFFQEILFEILKIDDDYVLLFYCVLFYKIFELNYSYFSTILSYYGKFYRQKIINVNVFISNFVFGGCAAYYFGLYGIVMSFALHVGLLAMLRMYYVVNSSFSVINEIKRVAVLIVCLAISVTFIENLSLQLGAQQILYVQSLLGKL